jgi:tripartite ATP-independent transporter DctP family solute receptor
MKNIMRRFGLTMAILMTIAVLAACGGNADAGDDDDTVTIRMGNQVDENNFLNQGYVAFKEIIEEKSDGRFNVEIYNGGTLVGSDEEIVEALKSGSIELSTSSAYGTANTTGADALKLFDMPMLVDSNEEAYELLDGEYGDIIKEQVAENTNLTVLGFVDLGWYGIMNGTRPIETPEDLNGLKIRTSSADLHLDTMSAMGGNPTPMAYSEVFTGMQQGTIDGVSTTTALIHGDRFFEVNEHLTLTNHVFLPHIMMVNNEFYDGLSDEMRTILDESIEEYVQVARDLSIEAEELAVKEMAEEGVEIVELTDESREAFRKKTEPVIEQHVDTVGQESFDKAMELLGR